MKRINIDIKYSILLAVISILALVLTYAHHGNLLIDCGREAYYPTQILIGKVLYKDIFNIYGPFAYFFNAVLFKLFSINLNVLYIAGCISTLLITIGVYYISKRFLPSFLSFSIAAFTVCLGVLTHYLSNFVFPYSFAMLYGLVTFLYSVLFLLKYQETQKKYFLYLSSFLAGLCIANKYEFLPYFAVIIYAIFKVKRLNIKSYFYTILSLLFVPALCFGILFLQGLRLQDLMSAATIYIKMAHSQTLKYFYTNQGVYFSPDLMRIEIIETLKTIVALLCLVIGCKLKNKIVSVLLVTFSLFLIIIFTNQLSFSLIPILIVLFTILNIENLKSNTALQLLVLSAICFSFKEFWGLIIVNYGTYFVGFLLITLISLIKNKFKDKDINFNIIGVYLLIAASILSFNNFKGYKDLLIKTPKGKIYTDKPLYEPSKELLDYINTYTKATDTIVILPEGAMFNFFTGRPTDNFYTSLIPLYVETFGEENIIKHFEQAKPEYIVFNNWDTSEYYYKYICVDYALGFCKFVEDNYTIQKEIGNNFKYLIFKKK